MKTSSDYFKVRSEISALIRKIPKKNREKFFVDFLTLCRVAQGDDYENFNFER